MSIDDAIQCTDFEDNYQKAVINIHYTYSWLNNVFRGDFQKFKLIDIANNLTEDEAETLNNLLDRVRGSDFRSIINS